MTREQFEAFRRDLAEHLGVEAVYLKAHVYDRGREQAIAYLARRTEIMGKAAVLVPGEIQMDSISPEHGFAWSSVKGENADIALFHAKPEEKETTAAEATATA